jgi:hypothetical protein
MPRFAGGAAFSVKALYLWNHLFADQRGYLALFSGARAPDPRRLLACAEGYFSRPDEADSAVECALADSGRGRESYFCAHLLTEKRRIKENDAPMRALYVDGDRAYPGEELPQPTAIIECSPGRLQIWWRLDSEVPPKTGEDLNRRLAYDTTASGYFDHHDALTSHEVQ